MNAAVLAKIERHKAWLTDPTVGEQLRLKKQTMSVDFSAADLRRAILSHSNWSGSKFKSIEGANFVFCQGDVDFQGADIAGMTFEKCQPSMLKSLVGTTWNGVSIEWVSSFWTNPYCVIQTNAFAQLGCMQKTLDDWIRVCSNRQSIEELRAESTDLNLDDAFAWWKKWEPIIRGLPRSPQTAGPADWVSQWDSRIDGFRWLSARQSEAISEPPFDPERLGQYTRTNK